MRAAGAAVLALALLVPLAAAQREAIEAYPDWPSARAGETLALHVSSRAPRLDVAVFREGEPEAPRWEAHDVAAALQPVPAGAPGVDTGWPVTCEIPLAAEWPSGPWRVRLSAGSEACEVPFLLRPATLRARILVLAPMCTVQAYNFWGGASLYRGPDRPPAPVVTLRRPLGPNDPYGRNAAAPLDAWLRARGLAADWAADIDLVRDPHLLDGCDLLVLAGHHEYWSAAMRAAVDAFVGDGGRLLVLGANTCYWQIRFEQDGTAIRCHKRADRDPLLASGRPEDLALVTSNWLGAPVLDPQERSLGLAWQHAESTAPVVVSSDLRGWILGAAPDPFPFDQGFGLWRVAAPAQADLAPLALARDAAFGAGTLAKPDGLHRFGACGGEVDGALTEELDCARPASSALGAPRNLLVLADAPAEEGFAAIAGFERVGEVLWCSSERLVPSLVAPGGVPDLVRLVEDALRRLSRPRRNLLQHGGFEAWEGDAPAGWKTTGSVDRAAAGWARLGGGALELPAGDAVVSQSIARGSPLLATALLVAHVGTPAPRVTIGQADRTLATAQAASPAGDVLAAAFPLPDRNPSFTVAIAARRDAPTWVDAIELLDPAGLDAECLALAPSDDGSRLISAPTPGGARHLLLVDDPRVADVSLADADDGRLLGHAVRPSARDPLLLVVDDGARGRMVRFALEARDAEGRTVLPEGARLLPLRVPSPAPAPLLRGGGFESVDTSARPSGWSMEGRGRIRLAAVACVAGASGLRIEAGDEPVTLGQQIDAPEGVPLVLTVWLRGSGDVSAALESDGRELVALSRPGDARWHALRMRLDAAPPEGSLRLQLRVAPDARVDLDEITVDDPTALLVDDLYPNGGFEIGPTPDEIARGADWSARLPRWASIAGPPPRLDDRQARSGRHALWLEPGARAATHLGWPLAAGAAAVVGVAVRAEAPGGVTLRLLAGATGSDAPPEIAQWTGGTPGTWVDAQLDVPPELVQGLPPDAFLVVEAGAGGAWLDDLSFVAAGAGE